MTPTLTGRQLTTLAHAAGRICYVTWPDADRLLDLGYITAPNGRGEARMVKVAITPAGRAALAEHTKGNP